ncbi:hypothetical protein [Motilibacter aurantiacus]|uniref:hypothetical protein n=1 Tax=Motilibacter aurantiacus TaxID=2714955 RepID=UPI00140E2262|nr:hypothetical protein [Motilibacter aurantiacus]NHC46406.1 hypothetical protein [Motilibacter aurantiacus]
MSTTRSKPIGRRRATLAVAGVGAAATAFVISAGMPASAAGCAQLTPPEITSFSFSPASVDVRTGEKKVKVTARVSDPDGVETVLASFVSPLGPKGKQSVAGGLLKLTSGSKTDGTYSGEAVVPRGVIPGAWKVQSVMATDSLGGSDFLRYDELKERGWSRDLAVKSTPDLKPPALTALTFAPAAVNTTAKAGRVKITAKATDNFSGVSFVSVQLTRKTKGAGTTPATLTVLKRSGGTATNGTFVGYAEIPRWVGKDAWLASAYVMDMAMNQTEYANAALAKKKWARSVSVTSGVDRTAPALVSAAPSPSTVTSGQAVNVTARATDAQSGVLSVMVTWKGDGGQLTVPLTRTGGTPQNGTWTGKGAVLGCAYETGTWSATATVTDVAGNVHEYSEEETAALGIGKLTVTGSDPEPAPQPETDTEPDYSVEQ